MAPGNFERCKICGEYGWFGGSFMNHSCKPSWMCRMETWDDDHWKIIYARDAESAAVKIAEYDDYNSGDFSIGSGNHEAIALVRQSGSDEIERWRVSGEMVPSYRAERPDDE
jgi:hypothetical protein